MTVKHLKELLANFGDDQIVVLSTDAEGNGFSPLSDLGEALYEPENTWSGECVFGDDIEEDEKPNAVVLWPTN